VTVEFPELAEVGHSLRVLTDGEIHMDGQDTERSAEPEEAPAPSSMWRDYLGRLARADVTRLLAVASAALYGILFLAYRGYYSALDIPPEDVGVNNSFILVRSPGFIVITVVVAAILFGMIVSQGNVAGPTLPSHKRAKKVASLLLPAVAAYYFYSLFPPTTSFLVLVLVLTLLVSIGPALQRLEGKRSVSFRRALAATVTICVAVVIPSIAVVQQGEARGVQARSGVPVQPFTVFGIPIVDVSAPAVTVTWANPAVLAPPDAFGRGPSPGSAEGLLLGQGNGFFVVNIEVGGERRLLRLTSASVIITFDA
jgi:hypothetical protein